MKEARHNNDEIIGLSNFELAIMIDKLLDKYKDDIEKQEFLRNLIDYMFELAVPYFTGLLKVYALLYFVPFIL